VWCGYWQRGMGDLSAIPGMQRNLMKKAILALLQQEPDKKNNYPVETRRECAIQAMQVELSQECNAWGADSCRSSAMIRNRAEEIVDDALKHGY
jgi:hypothetical protein